MITLSTWGRSLSIRASGFMGSTGPIKAYVLTPLSWRFFIALILAPMGGACGSNIFLIFSSSVVIVTPTSMSLNFLNRSMSRRTSGDFVSMLIENLYGRGASRHFLLSLYFFLGG